MTGQHQIARFRPLAHFLQSRQLPTQRLAQRTTQQENEHGVAIAIIINANHGIATEELQEKDVHILVQ